MQEPTIGIIGLSHLGIVASAGFASLGFRVIGVDMDAVAVKRLTSGDCIVQEPGLAELFGAYKHAMTFSTDFSTLAACKIVYIAKDTPTDEEKNEMDLEEVFRLIDAAIPCLADHVEVIVMSQVPVGFTRALKDRIAKMRPGLEFQPLYFAETLIVGDAVARFLKPERMIFGMADPITPLGNCMQRILSRFSCPVLCMKWESAELTKSAINLYLATSVTYANTLANICEIVGADMSEIIPALRLDKRIGSHAYLKPGLGLTGGHLERDIALLAGIARDRHIAARLLDLIQEESAMRYQWLCDALQRDVFQKTTHPTIAIWGLAYKKNTDSTFRAPSLRVIKDFGSRATIAAYDPHAKILQGSAARQVVEKYAAINSADVLLILCDWDEFTKIDFDRIRKEMRYPIIIDGLGVLYDVPVPEDITYRAMGKPYARETLTA